MNSKIETYGNIVLTIIGLILGIVFFMTENKDLSLILFSIAIASILYQFLGGIGKENTFQLGALKFGGAAAILIGFMYFLKTFIFIPTVENYNLNIDPNEDWIPISTETGKVREVSISNGIESKNYPSASDQNYMEARKKHRYQILNITSSKFGILLESTKDTIGFADIYDFQTQGLYNKTEIDAEEDMQVFRLYPEKDNQNATGQLANISLPFEIKVFSTSRFSILPYIKNREVKKKESYLIPGSKEDEAYIVFLEQANSEDSVKTARFSKWLVKKLKYRLAK